MTQKVQDERLRSAWDDVAGELRGLAGALGMRPEAVGDVLQDVYLAAFGGGPPGGDREDLRRWLIRVTVNRCNLEHRRKTRWRAAWRRLVDRTNGEAAEGTSQQPSEVAGRREERDLIRRALERLEPRLRTVLVLRYFADFNSREIAAMLEMADSTVRGHLRTAREKLARELQRAGYRHE